MVESQANELSEDVMLGAVNFGHEQFQPVIAAIIEMARNCAREPREIAPPAPEVAIVKEKAEAIRAEVAEAYKIVNKTERQDTLAAIREKFVASLGENEAEIAVAARC